MQAYVVSLLFHSVKNFVRLVHGKVDGVVIGINRGLIKEIHTSRIQTLVYDNMFRAIEDLRIKTEKEILTLSKRNRSCNRAQHS